jgi:hypothetical protein
MTLRVCCGQLHFSGLMGDFSLMWTCYAVLELQLVVPGVGFIHFSRRWRSCFCLWVTPNHVARCSLCHMSRAYAWVDLSAGVWTPGWMLIGFCWIPRQVEHPATFKNPQDKCMKQESTMRVAAKRQRHPFKHHEKRMLNCAFSIPSPSTSRVTFPCQHLLPQRARSAMY